MHKFVFLLIIPLIFTFIFDHYFIDEKKINITQKNLLNKFDPKIFLNVHDDINPSTINKLYSKKIIQNFDEKKIVKLKPNIIKLKPNIVNLKPEKKIDEINKEEHLDSNLYFLSSEWQNNFSNKKTNFILTVLPLIALENRKIILERKKLLNIKNFLSSQKTLDNNDLQYLQNITLKYKILSNNRHKIDLINELLVNVNVIPNSIALAQAANESGWGTSRFAREYNALFGQYTYDKNSGVVPYEREEGKKHLIKNFTSINKSVESYFININSHYAYENFRKIRSQMDDLDNDFNVKILTTALDVYAEDKSYVQIINKIIDSNNLNQFDGSINTFFNS